MQIPLFQTCHKCHKLKPFFAFSKRSGGSPTGINTICRECHNEHGRSYYQDNKDSVIQRTRDYKKQDPEKWKAYRAKYAKDNPEKTSKYQRDYRERHPDKAKLSIKNWRAKHPEHDANKKHKRRAVYRGLDATLTESEWLAILDMYKHRCVYCDGSDNISQDHWIPISRNGAHTKHNVVPACRTCNSRKKNKTGEEYFAWLGKPVFRLPPP